MPYAVTLTEKDGPVFARDPHDTPKASAGGIPPRPAHQRATSQELVRLKRASRVIFDCELENVAH